MRLEGELVQEQEKGLFSLPFKIPDEFFRMRESDLVGKVAVLQSYLTTLTSRVEYYVEPLLEFL